MKYGVCKGILAVWCACICVYVCMYMCGVFHIVFVFAVEMLHSVNVNIIP